ncbi:hypothetical protein CcI49_28365 [Frankia sp. CcI49]|nr:hypothetical protein CcI49_28365 [Frankia sp. CcI49]
MPEPEPTTEQLAELDQDGHMGRQIKNMIPGSSGSQPDMFATHPDLLSLARGPLTAFNAAVTPATMFHPACAHPDIVDLDARSGQKFAILADWLVEQIADGWPLETALDEAARRMLNIQHHKQGDV